MPEWIKSYLRQLNSTIIQELTDAEFGLWNKFLLLTGAQDPIGGTFKITDMEGFAGNIHSTEENIVETLKKLKNTKRVKVNEISEGLLIAIRNWHKYQDFTGKGVDSHKAPKNGKVDSRFLPREEKRREEERRGEKKREEGSSLSSPSLKKEREDAAYNGPKEFQDLSSLLARKVKDTHPDIEISEKLETGEWPLVFQGISQKKNIAAEELAIIVEFCFENPKDSFWTGIISSPQDIEKNLDTLRGQRELAIQKDPGSRRWWTATDIDREDEEALKDPGR